MEVLDLTRHFEGVLSLAPAYSTAGNAATAARGAALASIRQRLEQVVAALTATLGVLPGQWHVEAGGRQGNYSPRVRKRQTPVRGELPRGRPGCSFCQTYRFSMARPSCARAASHCFSGLGRLTPTTSLRPNMRTAYRVPRPSPGKAGAESAAPSEHHPGEG